MGLHTCTPVLTAEGYVGIDVHRGARIAALAHGGQVIVSEATAELLTDEPLRDLGRHRLKDFDAPAQLYQLGPGEFPPLRTPGAVDRPVHATAFLGRSRELYEAVSIWLDRDPGVLTIVGPGGTGKTRFSVQDHALAALDLDLQSDANRGALACAAILALVAAERGQAERAGRLWGAVESEQESRPVPKWERIRAQCEDRVLRADGETFARARKAACCRSPGPPGWTADKPARSL
jgi:hypothetical protein